ncbi:MAG: glycosyltransferase family 2 protein [Candidatus Omnitrophica bacterium]|nr:glycosyltransferase family 2 protein [Candidatus Omnitrophota bacterium]
MPGTNQDSISIVLPFYNEERHIYSAVEEIYKFSKNNLTDFEIILVDDGSNDDSCQKIEPLIKSLPDIKLIKHKVNSGYGAALASGFKSCSKKKIFFTDSDRQFEIKNLNLLLPYIEIFDIVIGYRKHRKDALLRLILSKGYNILMQILFKINVTDIDCAFKIFRREIFDYIKIESKRYSVNTEILAKARLFNFSIFEVPVEHFPRLGDYSKIGIKDIPRTLREVLRIKKNLTAITKSNA